MEMIQQKWIYTPRPNHQAKAHLICFHFAGASAQTFRKVGLTLDPSIELNAIQLPGHGDRRSEKLIRNMPELMKNLIPAIRILLDKPYFLFGQSLGGLIAFEAARQIRELNLEEAKSLLIASRAAPQILSSTEELTYTLPDSEFLSALESRYGTSPGSELFADEGMRDLMLPSLRADMEIYETYLYSHCMPFNFPITAFRGSEDPRITDENILAWESMTSKEFKTVEFPGGHFFWQKNEIKFFEEIQKSINQYNKY